MPSTLVTEVNGELEHVLTQLKSMLARLCISMISLGSLTTGIATKLVATLGDSGLEGAVLNSSPTYPRFSISIVRVLGKPLDSTLFPRWAVPVLMYKDNTS